MDKEWTLLLDITFRPAAASVAVTIQQGGLQDLSEDAPRVLKLADVNS